MAEVGKKAYPGMSATVFDCMLKGRFYQALLPKWQRTPKLDEYLTALYDWACMLEMHDQQNSAAVQARDRKAKGASHTEKSHKPVEQPRSSAQTHSSEKPTGESIGHVYLSTVVLSRE